MKNTYKLCAVAAVSGAVLATAGPARAANVDCSSATAVPNPVYIAGSSASKPFLLSLAKVLAAQSPPISILYLAPTSCNGLYDVTSSTADGTGGWGYADPVTGALDTCT